MSGARWLALGADSRPPAWLLVSISSRSAPEAQALRARGVGAVVPFKLRDGRRLVDHVAAKATAGAAAVLATLLGSLLFIVAHAALSADACG